MESCLYLLEEFSKNASVELRLEIQALRAVRLEANEAKDIPALMGYEGILQRGIMKIMEGSSKKKEYSTEEAKDRRDVGNSVLSLLYTILTNRIAAYIDGIGFDPFIGFLHSLEYGRLSLGCDMIEPLRPLFCDWFTLKLFNQKRIKSEDFEVRDNGYYLNDLSRKKFYPLLHNELKENRDYLYMRGELLDWVKFQTGVDEKVFTDGSVISLKEFSKSKDMNAAG
ncbi:MAG: CRISPR-associated endonuclease Cas1 [Leptospiraceae bacterium]|nr:CRISPR-associated endonuclease Cas1 [Leptospiraceae bacterium]